MAPSQLTPLHYMESSLSWFKTIKWKNPRAGPNTAYVPTPIEHVANVITHAIWIVPSVVASWDLIRRCQTPAQLTAALLYGGSLVLLFTVSTFFHSVFYCCQNGGLKDCLHRCDRAVIYIFIAASYFPWTVLVEFPSGTVSDHVCWLIWVLATAGICYQQLFHERYKTIETLCYMCMALLPAALLSEHCEHLTGYQEMGVGGLLYLLGVVFFKADGRIACAHAIWHCFVAAAAGLHYLTIAQYLFPIDGDDVQPGTLNRLVQESLQ